jgi:hypothetical protein
MKSNKHNFSLKYSPTEKTWSIYDDGVLHTAGYKNRKEAQKQIDELLGTSDKSQRSLIRLTKDWKKQIRNM